MTLNSGTAGGFRGGFGLAWDALKPLDGAGTRIRTGDLPLTRRLLYQLSYAGVGWNVLGTDCNGVALAQCSEARDRFRAHAGVADEQRVPVEIVRGGDVDPVLIGVFRA